MPGTSVCKNNNEQNLVTGNHRNIAIVIALILVSAFLISCAGASAPVANFTATPTSGVTPLPVLFTDNSAGNPTGWAWFFGDETYNEPWTEQTASAGWTARYGQTSVTMPNGGIVLMGGQDINGYKNDTWGSINDGATWAEINASSGWTARAAQSTVAMPDGSIVLMGGYPATKDVWRSTNNGTSWTEVNASAGWSARWGQSTVAMPDGSIVLMGGQNSTSYLNDVWRSPPGADGATWTQMTVSAGWALRSYQSSLVMPDGSIVLMGGSNSSTYYNDTWRSTNDGGTWTEMNASSGWDRRNRQTSVVMPDGSILLIGGYDGSVVKNDVWRSTNKGATWTEVNASAGWVARQAHTSVAMPDGSIVLIGGTNPGGSIFYNDTWRLMPTGSSMQNPVHSYTLPGIYSVALQAYNNGGYNTTQKTGFITVTTVPAPVTSFTATPISGPAPLPVLFADSSTGSPTSWAWFFGDETYTEPWTEQTASAGWAARYGPTSVVMPDGSIVLMGGQNSTSYLNDVWRSPPGADGASWTEMNASSGWTARAAQSTVAMPDGSIVLTGGYPETNDTWRSTNDGVTWTEMNASSGWVARCAQSTVAMPDDSIVLMGGYPATNDTWRSTNDGVTWTEMNASSGWVARSYQSSVVMPDGSIVLMGGSNGSTYYNDTWRSTNDGATWTEMNTSSGWDERNRQTSVVMPDGSILLMGGYDGSVVKNDMWRSTNEGATWTEVSASTGWVARQAHTNVAMPDGSIVLMGGSNGGTYYNDVWRLMPAGSSAQDPVHSYTTVGTFNVSLTSSNAGGYNTTLTKGYITVTTVPAPVANFTGTPTSGSSTLPFSFTDTSTGTPTGWAWFFGDENYTEPWTEQTASAGWGARDSFSSLAMPDGSIVIMGGWGNTDLNDVWRSTDKGVTWTELNANAGWVARDSQSSVVMPDGSIVLMGGENSDGSIYYNDTWRSTNEGTTWTEVNASAGWTARYGQSSVSMPDGSIVLMGGYDNSGNYRNDVWRSMNDGATWTEVNASAGWLPRDLFSSVVMPDGSIVLMGGTHYYNDVWRSTNDGATWTEVNASAGWSGRFGHSSMAMPDGSIVLMGGVALAGGDINDVWRSTNDGATWTEVNASAGWGARDSLSSVVMPDGSILLMGGAGSAYYNDTWQLMPAGSSAQNPVHFYTSGGTFNVSLTVRNAGGFNTTAKTGYITVFVAPVASFIANVTIGHFPLAVNFTDLSTNAPNSWNWTFGDGSFSTLQDPVHVYASAGIFTVSLNATNAAGSNISVCTNYIHVIPPEPIAGFTGTPISGALPLPVFFTDLSSNNPTGWAWFFGDENYTEPWTELNANAGWGARDSFSSLSMPDGSIVLMGGWENTDLNDVWRSTNDGATWTLMNANAGWVARDSQSSVVMPDGSIVLMGGYDGYNGSYMNDVWRSTDEGATWTELNANAGWGARADQSSVVMPDGSIVLLGGYFTSSDSDPAMNDTWRSTDEGATWTELNANAGWTARDSLSSVVMPDGSIVLMGGEDSSGNLYNDTWRSTDEGATWTELNASSGWSARYGQTSVTMPDGSIVLMGGEDSSSLVNDVWRSTNEGATWSLINASAGWAARDGHGSVVIPDGSIVLMGGWSVMGNYTDLNDVWRFMPAGSSAQNPSHTYTAPGTYSVALQSSNAGGFNTTLTKGYITVTTVISPVANFIANVTSGSSPFSVSFTDQSTNNPTGWAWFFGDENYTQPWTEVNAGAGWSARAYFSSVVMPDGNIVLMGGANATNRFNDTWRSTDSGTTWTKMSAKAPWPARANQKSVVMPDGSIVLMGGVGGGTEWNDVWRSTDEGATWTEVTSGAGWSPRHSMSAVVMPDGSIILFGGYDGTTYYNDVWRSTDEGTTWAEVNTGATWSARADRGGKVMPDGSIIIIGGYNGVALNDVWRSTDEGATWAEVNTGAVWVPRMEFSSAVMPDGSIVLMGGNTSVSDFLNDVWRSTDEGATWAEVNASAGWSGRSAHPTVGMPDGSIVLMGGYDGSTYHNDVWQFQPVGSSAQNPVHTYATGGTFNVSLTSRNAGGYNTTLKTGYVTVTSAPYIEVNVNGSINNWNLVTGTNQDTSSVSLNITTNINSWQVSAVDNLDNGKPSSTAGHMAEWNGGSYVTSGYVLQNPINIKFGGGTYFALSNTTQLITSGTSTGTTIGNLGISQVIAATDPALATGHQYQIVVTLTGSST
jgi:uncharacterized delta-60 repeat protein